MSVLIKEFGPGELLEPTEVFVDVNDRGTPALVFSRFDKREHVVLGHGLERFGLAQETLLNAVSYPGRKTLGRYSLPSTLVGPLLDYAEEINAVFKQEQ